MFLEDFKKGCKTWKNFRDKQYILYNLTDIVIQNCYKNYPELEEKKEYIKKVIKLEEERFDETIELVCKY